MSLGLVWVAAVVWLLGCPLIRAKGGGKCGRAQLRSMEWWGNAAGGVGRVTMCEESRVEFCCRGCTKKQQKQKHEEQQTELYGKCKRRRDSRRRPGPPVPRSFARLCFSVSKLLIKPRRAMPSRELRWFRVRIAHTRPPEGRRVGLALYHPQLLVARQLAQSPCLFCVARREAIRVTRLSCGVP